MGAPRPTTTHLTLTRLSDSGQETMGVLRIGDGGEHPLIYTLEDTWKNNASQVSCIPPGTYTCVPHGWKGEPVKFKQVWRLLNTGPRVAILIHAGNTHLDTHGCILVGFGKGRNNITDSRKALDYLRRLLGQSVFTITIEGVK